MPTDLRRDLEKRARAAILKNIIESYKQRRKDWLNEPAIKKAVWTYAFFRPSNAVLIAAIIVLFGCLTVFLFPLLGLGGLGWLAIGGLGGLLFLVIAEILFLYASIRDEKAHATAVAEIFESQVKFEPTVISDRVLRAKVDKALEYWSLIDDAIDKVPPGVLRDRLLKTTREVTHWLQAVYNLAERVDKFRLNKVIEQDLENVPKTIKSYEQKLATEDNPDVRQQLEKTIADRKRQLRTLQNLQDNMEKAVYQLDGTISSLGTIYSQLLLVGTKDEGGGRISRLQEEISEQVYQLEDLTEAMNEVYQSSV
jgi:rubrerythrin